MIKLVALVDRLPLPPAQRGRGRPRFYPERLFFKALVIMIVRHLHSVYELLRVFEESTAEMQCLRGLLVEQGRYPTRRRRNKVRQGLLIPFHHLDRHLTHIATRFTQQLPLQVIARMRGHTTGRTAKKIDNPGVELKQGFGVGLNDV